MQSIYKTILRRFVTSALLPVFFIEVSLVFTLFWMNSSQSENTKESLRQISAESFSQIAQGTGQEIQQQFLQAKHEISQLNSLASEMFTHPNRYRYEKLKMYKNEGFFHNAKPGERSSVYTTNLLSLKAKDKKALELLALLDKPIEKLVQSNKDLLQSAWINISKYYNLFYPKIDVVNELSWDLDVTKQMFYYEADPKHNPSKEIRFISLYENDWATQFGQMGAYLSPIYDKKSFVGVLGVSVTVNKTVKTLMDLKLPFKAFAVLVDEKKNILASSNEEKSFEVMGVHSFYSQYLLAKENLEFSPLKVINPAKLLKQNKMIFPYKIEGTKYTIMFCADYKDVYGPVDARHQYVQDIALNILVAIAFFYTLYFFYMFRHIKTLALKIAKPLQKMVYFSSKLGEDETLEVTSSNIVELDILNKNFLKTHERLIDLVNYDQTTGVYNHQKLRRDIKVDKKQQLILFKLENFNQYNNLFGPLVGSQTLKEVVKHIKACETSIQGALYRESTDTIALLLEDSNKELLLVNLDSILKRIANEKVFFEGLELNLSLKAGLVLGDIDDGIDLIAQAQISVAEALLRRVDRYVVYEDIFSLTKVYHENILWSKHVKDAFLEKRFIAFYQPIYCYETKKIEKFESLVRMELNGEIISPFKFLDAASSLGRLHEITIVMVDHVFEMALKYPEIEFSVNTTFADFEEARLCDYVSSKLKATPIDTSKIIFELLETQTFSDSHIAIEMISVLQELGFKIAIDDFGTGHSNFSHLALLNVDYIKIDGMFVKNLEVDEMSSKMVKSMVSFSKEIGAKTIAEYVHNEAVFKKVEALGVDFAQGYYKSEPLSHEDVAKLLRS